MADHLVKHGKKDRARELHEAFVEAANAIKDSEALHGTNLYNLACFYARFDSAELAVGTLGQALALNPALTEWSKEDSDLDSLRYMDSYKALYPE
jgi:hypothetical protein